VIHTRVFIITETHCSHLHQPERGRRYASSSSHHTYQLRLGMLLEIECVCVCRAMCMCVGGWVGIRRCLSVRWFVLCMCDLRSLVELHLHYRMATPASSNAQVGRYKMFLHFEARVQSFPAPTCIVHPAAILLHDYWALCDPPSDLPCICHTPYSDDDCIPPRDTFPHQDSTGTAPSGTSPPAQPPPPPQTRGTQSHSAPTQLKQYWS